jgi:hypothetical protein
MESEERFDSLFGRHGFALAIGRLVGILEHANDFLHVSKSDSSSGR